MLNFRKNLHFGRGDIVLSVIITEWYNINNQDVLEYSPSLADKFALNNQTLNNQTMNIDEIAKALAEVLVE